MNKRAIRFFIILILVIIVVIVANISMRNFGIAQINITVEYAGGDTLIDKRDVSTMISKRFGNPLSKKRKEVNGEEIEEYLLKQNFVASANVYLTLGGKLNVEVRQNRPIARIYTSDGGQFYVDENKEVCDISKCFDCEWRFENKSEKKDDYRLGCFPHLQRYLQYGVGNQQR